MIVVSAGCWNCRRVAARSTLIIVVPAGYLSVYRITESPSSRSVFVPSDANENRATFVGTKNLDANFPSNGCVELSRTGVGTRSYRKKYAKVIKVGQAFRFIRLENWKCNAEHRRGDKETDDENRAESYHANSELVLLYSTFNTFTAHRTDLTLKYRVWY